MGYYAFALSTVPSFPFNHARIESPLLLVPGTPSFVYNVAR